MLQRFDETDEHMFLMVEPRFGFIVPKRELAPATVDALRRTKDEFDAAKARAERMRAPAQRAV